MIELVLIALLAVVVAILFHKVKRLEKKADRRTELPAVVEYSEEVDAKDAAAHAVEKHVQEHHRR